MSNVSGEVYEKMAKDLLASYRELIGRDPSLEALALRLVTCEDQVSKYQDLIREVKKQWEGDDKCWLDLFKLFEALPEGFVRPTSDTFVELENCVKFIKKCHIPGVEYVSPQRKIETLEEELKGIESLQKRVRELESNERAMEFLELEGKLDSPKDERVWQRLSGDNWVFGVLVRGLIRDELGEVYFNEGSNDPSGGWVWFTRLRDEKGQQVRGVGHSLQSAVAKVEEAFGLDPKGTIILRREDLPKFEEAVMLSEEEKEKIREEVQKAAKAGFEGRVYTKNTPLKEEKLCPLCQKPMSPNTKHGLGDCCEDPSWPGPPGG